MEKKKMDFLNNVTEMLDKGKCPDSNYGFLVQTCLPFFVVANNLYF